MPSSSVKAVSFALTAFVAPAGALRTGLAAGVAAFGFATALGAAALAVFTGAAFTGFGVSVSVGLTTGAGAAGVAATCAAFSDALIKAMVYLLMC
jgi:hypothetical protein